MSPQDTDIPTSPQDNDISTPATRNDPLAVLDDLLSAVSLARAATGGAVSIAGQDPILPAAHRLGACIGIPLMATPSRPSPSTGTEADPGKTSIWTCARPFTASTQVPSGTRPSTGSRRRTPWCSTTRSC